MALRKLRQQGTAFLDEAERKLAKGVPLIARIEEIDSDQETVEATLLMDAFGAKRGTRVAIKQAPTLTYGPDQLKNAIIGTQYDAKAQSGDIVGFSAAYLENDTVMAGRIGARTHGEMLGNVQVIMAPARPSTSRVTKKGATQFLSIADPFEARSIRTLENAEKFMRAFEQEKLDAGTLAGVIMRTKDRNVGEFRPTEEKDISYLMEELEHDQIFADNEPITFIPTMNIQVGRDQIRRELDPKIPTDGWVRGKLSRQYTHENGREAGFRPTIVVISDEEEWAFGGKTGKIKRYASGIQPAIKCEPIMPRDLEVPTKDGSKKIVQIQRLYTEEQMAAAAEERGRKTRFGEVNPPSPSSGGRPTRPGI